MDNSDSLDREIKDQHPQYQNISPLRWSESTKEIKPAMIKAQQAMGAAIKDSTNPFYRSKYADLTENIFVCKKPLNDNGIGIFQPLTSIPGGVRVTTILIHTSGESVECDLDFPAEKEDPQAYGKVATYARRYSLNAFLSIPSEDDDANSASQNKPQQKSSQFNPSSVQSHGPQSYKNKQSHGPDEVAGPSPIAPPWAPKTLAGKPLNQLKKPQLKALLDLVSKRIQQDKANDDPNNAFVAKDKALKQNLEVYIQAIRDQEKETAATVPSKPQQDPVVEAAKETKPEPPAKPEPKQAEAQTADDDAAKLSLKEEASLLCDQLKSMPNGALRLIEVMDSLRIHTLRSATEAEIPPFIDALIKEINKGEDHAAGEN